jgi:RNA polymerase sigma-70 factor, ECF subfamily
MMPDIETSWKELREGLRTFIAQRVRNESDVEDLLQEVFLRMHRRMDTLKDLRRLVPWVFQVTRHAIIDHYRSPGRQREFPIGLAADIDEAHPLTDPGTPGVLTVTPREMLVRCLTPMIERLTEPYREAVRLADLEGLTQTAAAKRLGLSVPGMKSRVQRGRRELRRMLEECCRIQLDRRRGIADYTPRRSDGNPCGCSESKSP